jgi:hypothetical protein
MRTTPFDAPTSSMRKPKEETMRHPRLITGAFAVAVATPTLSASAWRAVNVAPSTSSNGYGY